MLYVILSALLFAITLIMPRLSILTMMLFLIPLHKIKDTNVYMQVFIWGLIVFGTSWYWIIVLFKNQSLFYTGIIIWVIATMWCSLFSSVWIYFFSRWPTISTVIFFTFATKGILCVLGNIEGIPFLNPILFMAEYTLVLTPLYYVGDIGMFTIIFGIQNIVAQQKIIIQKLYIVLITVSFLSLLFLQHKPHNNYLMQGVGIVTPWWHNQKKGAMFDGYRLAHDICTAVSENKTQVILTPESTFCFDVNEYQDFISIWCDSANNVPILLGTHIKNELFPHNAVLMLHNHEIRRCYFKQHKLPFLERTLWLERFLSTPLLCLECIPEDTKSLMFQNDLISISGKMYQLYMCSEFFMEVKKSWGYPILLLWNDTWLSCSYMKRLAFLFITYFELKNKIKVYHVATSGETNITM